MPWSPLGVTGEIGAFLLEGEGDGSAFGGEREALTTTGGGLVGTDPVIKGFDFVGPGRWGGVAGGREGGLGTWC